MGKLAAFEAVSADIKATDDLRPINVHICLHVNFILKSSLA